MVPVILFLVLFFSLPIAAKSSGEWNAKKYAQNSSPQFKNALTVLHLLNLKGTESILDVGCGNGQLDAYILKHFLPRGTIHGVDASLNQVEQAQKNYEKNKRLSFAQADILTYVPSQQYDVVISFWVLHWVKDYEHALRQIFKALKPGGRALIGHLAEHELVLLQEVKKMMQEAPWKKYCKNYEFPIYSFPIDRMVSAARSAGFIMKYVQLINISSTFKDVEKYKQHYQAVPIAACIPEDQKESFFTQALQRALPQEQHNKNGSIAIYGYAGYMLLEKPK